MAGESDRLAAVIAAIDAANARDPNCVEIDSRREPAALVYGRRMSETLAGLVPDASVHLRIAARGQHIERWSVPRQRYPAGRIGYLQWRKYLQELHARRVGEIMARAGYDADAVARVGALLRKERLKSDGEAQLLEDVACLVFLQDYLAEFAAKTDEGKLAGILAKTWHKMSERGQALALKLSLAPQASALVANALAELRSPSPE